MQISSSYEQFRTYFLSLPSLQQAGYFLWPSLSGCKLSSTEIQLLKEIKPSGIIFFKRNLSSVDQAKNLMTEIRQLVENKQDPFFKTFITCIDEEGGRVSRLPLPHDRGKSALEFSDCQDKEGLIKQVTSQCQAAKEIGLNCLLAPVADILTEPTNPVMGDRCFGRDACIVSEYASLVHQTLHSQNMFSCAKHFPGHGNTLTDSHKELSTSLVSLEELKAREWLPFKKLIEENVPFIMAAHVLLPAVDAKNPATLSYEILTKHLREELHFAGLILSDDLRMNAIALHYQVEKKQDASITEEVDYKADSLIEEDAYLQQACLDALNAGCDILLSCQSIEREFIIAQTIAKQLETDTYFLEKMLEKAWRVYNKLR